MASAVDWSIFSLTGIDHLLNQDRCGADGELFCIADGMGGPAGGHIAATVALRSVFAAKPTDAELLRKAVEAANRAVCAAGRSRPGESDMGTALTAVLITRYGLVVASVGDTRCHLSGPEGVRLLTHDDTLATTLEILPGDSRYQKATSVLTRSLGSEPEVEVEVVMVPIDAASTVVLTSDGVHEHVALGQFEAGPTAPLDAHALLLVNQAQLCGSFDDASAVVIAVEP